MLIAVSSFGEGLRRVTPLTTPAEALIKSQERSTNSCAPAYFPIEPAFI